MTIELNSTQWKRLEELARQSGKSPEALALELLEDALFTKRAPKIGEGKPDPAYEPSRTELGHTLRSLRRKYVETGGRLYSLEEINQEIAEGRGER